VCESRDGGTGLSSRPERWARRRFLAVLAGGLLTAPLAAEAPWSEDMRALSAKTSRHRTGAAARSCGSRSGSPTIGKANGGGTRGSR